MSESITLRHFRKGRRFMGMGWNVHPEQDNATDLIL